MIMNNTERNTFLVRLGLSLPTAAHVSLRSSPFQPRSGNGDCRRRRSRQGRSRRSGRCTGYRTLFLEEATPCIAGASYTLVKHGHSVDNRQEKVRHTFLFLDVTHCLCVILNGCCCEGTTSHSRSISCHSHLATSLALLGVFCGNT